MKSLITGGAGFIGCHLARRLLGRGYEVVLADDFSRGVKDAALSELESEKGVTLVSADLMDADAAGKLGHDFDYIYHLAAIIGVRNVLEKPYAVLHNNTELMFRMMELAGRQRNLKRFVFASTSEVYAGTLQHFGLAFPTPEDTPLALTPLEHPRTSYMLSKIYGEALLNQSSLPWTIVRPHNFYGPRMGLVHAVPGLLRKAYLAPEGGEIDVPSAGHRRTFCYIDDGTEMMARLAENDEAAGQAYNLGNGGPETEVREVARLALEITGREDVRIRELPPDPGSPERRCPDMGKTYACIRYRGKVSLEDGMRRTFVWYKEHVFDGGEASAV